MHLADKHVDLQSAKLLDYAPYQAVYATVTKLQAEKGSRPDGNHDPLDNTGQETFTTVQIQQLANQVRDLKVMVFEASLRQHTGRVPVFLSRAQEFQHAASVDLHEEEQACHRAFEHILQMADAGKHHAIAVWHTAAWWSCCKTCTVQTTFAACEPVIGSMSPDFFCCCTCEHAVARNVDSFFL